MSKYKFKQISGSSPPLVSGDSLFEWLINHSDNKVTNNIEGTISALEEIISYGSNKAEATGEFPHNRSAIPEKVFEVLSLDLAVVFPENFEKKNERIFGKQFWMCKTNETTKHIWYERALKNYFDMPPGGSLLNYPEVQQSRNRWQLSSPNTISIKSSEEKSTQDTQEFKNIIRKGDFEPSILETSPIKFSKRFEQFGTCVFDELIQIFGDTELNFCSLLWIYVGLSEEEKTTDQKSTQNVKERKIKKFPWGASLFAVIKPINVPTDCEHWTQNANLTDSLRKAVDKLYLYLEAEGYKSIQKHRLEKEKEAFQLNIAQAISHEFKNLTRDVSVLGVNINNQFRNISITAQHHLGEDSEVSQQLSKLRSDFIKLSSLSGFLSAISLATYWLTTADQSGAIEFIDDTNCEIFNAVAFFALDLCQATKPQWIIDGIDLEKSLTVIEKFYGVREADELVNRIDFALLLFVLNEPIRNVRSNDFEKPEVRIKIEVRGKSLFLCQETLEREPAYGPVTSNAVKRVNKFLLDSEGLSKSFIHISEQTVPKKCMKQSDGFFKVNRETEIKVFKIPRQK